MVEVGTFLRVILSMDAMDVLDWREVELDDGSETEAVTAAAISLGLTEGNAKE